MLDDLASLLGAFGATGVDDRRLLRVVGERDVQHLAVPAFGAQPGDQSCDLACGLGGLRQQQTDCWRYCAPRPRSLRHAKTRSVKDVPPGGETLTNSQS